MIHYGTPTPSIGVIVGPLAAFAMIALLLTARRLINRHEWDSFDRGPARIASRYVIPGLIVCILVGLFVALFPPTPGYHTWRHVSGNVSSTNYRFLSDGKATNQKFVVTFDGSSQQFGCSDTRCASVRVGDMLTLTCKRTWQLFGTPGYDCNYVSYVPKDAS